MQPLACLDHSALLCVLIQQLPASAKGNQEVAFCGLEPV